MCWTRPHLTVSGDALVTTARAFLGVEMTYFVVNAYGLGISYLDTGACFKETIATKSYIGTIAMGISELRG